MCYVDLVVQEGSSFLLIKRLENPAKGKWWFPGGRILFNEALEQAVKRKLKEEVNIKSFRKLKFLGVKEIDFKKGPFDRPVYGIANVFLVVINRITRFNVKVNKTAAIHRWFEKIPKNSHPYLKKFLKLAGFK